MEGGKKGHIKFIHNKEKEKLCLPMNIDLARKKDKLD